MSLASLPMECGLPEFTTTRARAAMPRRPGRPRVQEDPKQRMRHLKCAVLRLKFGCTVEQVANRLDVSDRTVERWTAWALEYPEGAFLHNYRRSDGQ